MLVITKMNKLCLSHRFIAIDVVFLAFEAANAQMAGGIVHVAEAFGYICFNRHKHTNTILKYTILVSHKAEVMSQLFK